MSARGEGESFVAAFNELKGIAKDSPELLPSLESEQRVQDLCDKITSLVRGFEIAEEWSPLPFTPHASTAGSIARREYEQRWAKSVNHIANRWIRKLVIDLDFIQGMNIPVDKKKNETEDILSANIDNWKSIAICESESIESAFDYLSATHSDDQAGDFDWVEEAENAWLKLTKVCGLDPSGALWRRRAVPHVLIPGHVSNRYGASKASLYRRLYEAGKAFIFGAPLAALALQRAVMEEVLKEHWGAETGHIRDANLPDLAWDSRAGRLKRLANDALHNDPEQLMPDQLDRAIIENFLLLRLLIENAPFGDPSAGER